jgi:hypothetical protein
MVYQSFRADPPADPKLLAKFKCHPTIPCDIPRTIEDLKALWYHIPDDLLPTNWSSDWFEISLSWFRPCITYNLSMGCVDILLKTDYVIPYPIKGVMFCTVDRVEPGGLFEQELPLATLNALYFKMQLAITTSTMNFRREDTNMWPSLGLLVGQLSVTL